MRIIFVWLFFFSAAIAIAEDDLRPIDYKLAKHYGYLPSDLRDAYKEVKKIPTETIVKQFMQSIEVDPFKAAIFSDEAIDQMIITASVYLNAEGHQNLADDITFEYQIRYRGYYTRMFLEEKEIGDHPAINSWLETVHERLHRALGDFICKGSHIHDVYILNHGNVVFKPQMANDFKDYKDHFAGHLIWGWFWDHHGFAGVVSYWLVNGLCTGGTSGMGLITFVCGSIASLAENQVDERIAPPIARRIWDRVDQHFKR